MDNIKRELDTLNKIYKYEFATKVTATGFDTYLVNIFSKSGFILAKEYIKDIDNPQLIENFNPYTETRLRLSPKYDRLAEMCIVDTNIPSNRLVISRDCIKCSYSLAVVSEEELDNLIDIAYAITSTGTKISSPLNFSLFEARDTIRFNGNLFIALINGMYVNLLTGNLATTEEYNAIQSKLELLK